MHRPGEDRAWLLTAVSNRTTKRRLLELIGMMPEQYRGAGVPSLKAELLAWLVERRQQYWNDNQSLEPGTPSRRTARPSRGVGLCKITATEANDWLRSLPTLENR